MLGKVWKTDTHKFMLDDKICLCIGNFHLDEQSAVIMPTIGNQQFNWNARCLEQEYIRWHNLVQVHKTKEAHKKSNHMSSRESMYIASYDCKFTVLNIYGHNIVHMNC